MAPARETLFTVVPRADRYKAKAFIDSYFERHAGARSFLDSCIAEAETCGTSRDQAERAWRRARELSQAGANLIAPAAVEESRTALDVAQATYEATGAQLAQSADPELRALAEEEIAGLERQLAAFW